MSVCHRKQLREGKIQQTQNLEEKGASHKKKKLVAQSALVKKEGKDTTESIKWFCSSRCSLVWLQASGTTQQVPLGGFWWPLTWGRGDKTPGAPMPNKETFPKPCNHVSSLGGSLVPTTSGHESQPQVSHVLPWAVAGHVGLLQA